MTIFEELSKRGLIAQMTHPEKIEQMLNGEQVTFYIGFDATADSLHVGHFLQLVVMGHLQRAGHRPIALLGTGTTMIGDPTGKTDMRKMLTIEEINHNAECFKKQMNKLLDFSDGKALMMKNGDWLLNLEYLPFLRDVGVHFSVNQMLSAECFKSRLERGLSFIEFNYMIMQSYDFLYLHRNFGCNMQLGGNDQWANILGGIDLTRRVTGDEVYGMTFTLLTTKEGKKMGKTENGAVWLDPEKTSPYDFFQYWRNVADEDAVRCMKLLTYVPLEEIEQMEQLQGSELNKVKERLAYEVTRMVHGQEWADQALSAASSIFGAGVLDVNMPTTTVSPDAFTDDQIAVVDLLVLSGLAPSKAEAKRLISGGGIAVDEGKCESFAQMVNKSEFEKGYVILRKGKKVYHKVVL